MGDTPGDIEGKGGEAVGVDINFLVVGDLTDGAERGGERESAQVVPGYTDLLKRTIGNGLYMKANYDKELVLQRGFQMQELRIFGGKPSTSSKVSVLHSHDMYGEHDQQEGRKPYDLPDISKTGWYVCCDCSTKELCI